MASYRDRKYAKGEPKGDGRIPWRKRARPEPPDKENPVRANLARGAEIGEPEGLDLLRLIQDAETISREFHTATLAGPLAGNYRAVSNKHAQGSKYLGPGFKGRSRLFVPKTLLAIRKNLATAAAALFSTDDVANISAVYEDDKKQRATAATKKELLNYRMTRGDTPTSINWFRICMAGVRDSQIAGAVVSKQYWEFATVDDGEEEIEVDILNDDTGEFEETVKLKRPIKKIVRDRPVIDIIPIENCSIDPAAPWWDPVGGGHWFRAHYALYVQEAKDMIASAGPEQGFLKVEDIDFTKGRVDDAERSATRRAREAGRDRVENSRVGAFDPIWLVENFIRVDGKDLHFWTIGETAFASKVNETGKVYPAFGGDRPYKMGVAAIEGHKVVPMSPVESWQQLQLEINDVVNLRLDTLKRAIAPLTLVKRGKKIDFAALLRRGQPEAVVQVDSIDDVAFTPTPGPNGAAYTETSVNSNWFDELAGVMSTSSVANNRQLNETVGGMNIMTGAANSVSEFDLRVIVETWVEPVLRQVSRLSDYYETDETAMRVAGAKAQAMARYGYLPTFEDLENTDVTIRVNVGIGSADPMQRLAKMGQALQMLAPIYPEIKTQGISINGEEIVEEVFGQAGFKDGRRFFNFGEPVEQQQQDPELIKIMEELKLRAREIELSAEEMKLDYRSSQEDRANKLTISREEGERDILKDVIDHVVEGQVRQEDRVDQYVGRAADQNFQRQSKATDHGFQRETRQVDHSFQREARAADQGFQRENRGADQNFQREPRAHASMESVVGKLTDHFISKGKMPPGGSRSLVPRAPEPQQPQLPSSQDLVVSAILQRLDQMQQRQETAAQQTAVLFAQAIGQLASAMRTPKQVVFGIGPDGRRQPIGLAPGTPVGAIPPTRQ